MRYIYHQISRRLADNQEADAGSGRMCRVQASQTPNLPHGLRSVYILMASHGVICCGTDLESSTQLNSGTIMRHHMVHHIHVHRINGSPAADM